MTQTEQQNVPALRFPGFEIAWESEPLSKRGISIKSGRTKHEASGKYPAYGSTGRIGFTDQIEFSGEALLVARVGANAGLVNKVSGDFGVTDNTLVVIPDEQTDLGFLEDSLRVFNLNRLVFGSGQPLVTGGMLKRLKRFFPTLPEQRKIAGFLGAVDERIAQVTRKKALLEDYKKGCMQQLFSQSIRFKDDQGNDFPDWKEKRLGEKVQVLAGLTYSPDDIRENGTLVLRSSNVQSGEIAIEDNVYVDLKTSKANMSKKYDILLCVRNGSQRLIGKSAIIKKHMENTTHGAFMTVLRGEDNLFIFQLLQTQLFFKEVHKNLGATINSINGSDLKKMRFFIPSSKDERRKIADFLSAIDTKIDLVAQELEQAKTFKKSLLQQMFV